MKRNLLLVVLVSMLAGCLGGPDERAGAPRTGEGPAASPAAAPEGGGIEGRAVGLDGRPVEGASVSTRDGEATTDEDGRFELPASEGSRWVTVTHPDFLQRTRGAAAGSPVLFRLTPDDGETVSLSFAGDTMFGRRFYDRNEDGDTSDGLLQPGAGVEDHLSLLDDARPLLDDADVTSTNLEAPLTADPYFDPTGPRPSKWHPTKDYVFASDGDAAYALREAGVDVVGLGNNHLYDLRERGVTTTLNALDGVDGLARFGAGLSEGEAWEPAVAEVRGQKVAFLGCTSVVFPGGDGPEDDPLSFVASGEAKGGAAGCSEESIRANVAEARRGSDAVVMMIHGGYEYDRTPSENVRRMTAVAREAGATLVINHHPHVVGGFEWDGSSLAAWTLGNLLFDQTVWPTFESYLLTVDVRRGRVVRAYAEPLMIEGYKPRGVTGGLADHVAREAAGREPGPFLIEDGAMEVDLRGAAQDREVSVPLDGGDGEGTVFRLGEGSRLKGFSGENEAQPGRDLLWTGSFSDELVDAEPEGEAPLWDLEGDHKVTGPAYAYDEGGTGARISRDYGDRSETVLSPLHRVPVEPGTELSVVGMARAGEGARVDVRLSWYSDTKGPSATRTTVPLELEPGAWGPFRVDVTVPENAVAVGLYPRLQPHPAGLPVAADFDEVRMVEWAPSGTPFGPLYDHVRIVGAGRATVAESFLPGAEGWADPREPEALPRGETATPVAEALPELGRPPSVEE